MPADQPTAAPASGADVEAMAMLAEASRLLVGSLDVERTVQRLLGILVPGQVPWALLSVEEDDGAHEAARLGAGGDGVAHLRWEPSPDSGSAGGRRPGVFRHSTAGVVGTGRRVAIPRLAPDDLPALMPEPWHDEVGHLLGRPALVLPLRARGRVLGALCLLGAEEPSRPARLPVVLDLCQRVAHALDAARLHRERSHIAAVLQRGLRPPSLPEVPGLDVAAFQRPADAVGGLGGDFYDLHGSDGEWSLAVGDVAGKGVEAAVLTGKARQAMRTAALVDRRPATILALLNAVLLLEGGTTFVTVACGRLRPLAGGRWRLDVAAAGHPPPLVVRASGAVGEVGIRGTAVGAFPDRAYEEASVVLGPGDACVLVTDGVTEARDAQDVMFGDGGLQAVLRASAGAAPDAVVEHVARGAVEHRAGRKRDDLAVLALRVRP